MFRGPRSHEPSSPTREGLWVGLHQQHVLLSQDRLPQLVADEEAGRVGGGGGGGALGVRDPWRRGHVRREGRGHGGRLGRLLRRRVLRREVVRRAAHVLLQTIPTEVVTGRVLLRLLYC